MTKCLKPAIREKFMKTEIKDKITSTNQKYLKKFLTEEAPAKLESQLVN